MRVKKITDLPPAFQAQARQKLAKCSDDGQKQPKSKARNRTPSQTKLWNAVKQKWPEAISEYHAIDGRKYRVDIAFVQEKIAIEVEGWSNHGKYKRSHQHDCVKNNAVVLSGWSILRFYHGHIMNDIQSVLKTIGDLRKLKKQSQQGEENARKAYFI